MVAVVTFQVMAIAVAWIEMEFEIALASTCIIVSVPSAHSVLLSVVNEQFNKRAHNIVWGRSGHLAGGLTNALGRLEGCFTLQCALAACMRNSR